MAPAPRIEPAPAKGLADRATGLLANPMLVGGAAAAVILGIALVVFLRRRRPLPDDVDFSAMDDDEPDDEMSDGGFVTAGSARADEADDDLFGGVDRAASEPATSSCSIFDDDDSMDVASATQGDQPMAQNLSGMKADTSSRASSSAAGGDIARIVQELQARVGALEGKLDEANEARVRLERQVAAQSEELRVQRAAIARTQRALRSMTRPDEDKATEPALKDAETQMKTRVNG